MLSWFNKVRGKRRDVGPGRRHHERTKARLPFGLFVEDQSLVGTTSELCMNGARLQVEGGVDSMKGILGSPGVLKLMLPDGEIRCDCKVHRAQVGGLAVELVGLRGTPIGGQLMEYLETQLGEVW